MGYGDMACSNPESKSPTPNLDRLADEGMRFTNAHAASSLCTPSRYSILTGRYNWRSSMKEGVCMGYDGPLIESGRTTVASFLRDRGYATACIGKWHLGHGEGDLPDRHGFERSFVLGAAEHLLDLGWQVDTLGVTPDTKRRPLTRTSVLEVPRLRRFVRFWPDNDTLNAALALPPRPWAWPTTPSGSSGSRRFWAANGKRNK